MQNEAHSYLEVDKDGPVQVLPLLTVPECARNGYRMGGVPDGIGAFRTGPNTFDILLTHELRYNYGGPHRHAPCGSYISRWRFSTERWNTGVGGLELLWGEDLIESVIPWDYGKGRYKTDAKRVLLERLCSADLPAPSALSFQDEAGVVWGTDEKIFFSGEETHTAYKPVFGRAFAHVVTGDEQGKSWELPKLGKGSWENILLSPAPQKLTIAMLPDDATEETSDSWNLRAPTSELYLYVGEKERASSDAGVIEKAGLTNGRLYGVQVVLDDGETIIGAEDDELGFGGSHSEGKRLNEARFRLVDLEDRSEQHPEDQPGVQLQKRSIEQKVTQFLRPEDGSWDPRAETHSGHFWVVTTGRRGHSINSRLFELAFDDISNPLHGGSIFIRATGRTEGKWAFSSLDSVCVDSFGRVIVQEDPGGATKRSRTLILDENGDLRIAAEASKDYFNKEENAPNFITENEESAGIVPVFDILGDGWYLTTVQCNKPKRWPASFGLGEECDKLKAELVTPGQLLAIHIPQGAEKELSKISLP